METKHTHFWEMASDIRAYVKETGLRVLSSDRKEDLTIGFATNCPEDDPKYRVWRIRIVDVQLTANKREGGFEGWSDADMCKLTHHMMASRNMVAEVLSTGILP